MKWFLLKFNADYADEFDVSGCCIMCETDLNEYKKAVTEAFRRNETIEFYFGTNEYLEYGSETEFWGDIKIVPVDSEQKDILEELGFDNFGFFPDIEFFNNWSEE